MFATNASWMVEGSCASHPNPDLWYGETDERMQAKRICDECPMLAQCREWALHEWPTPKYETFPFVIAGMHRVKLKRERERLNIAEPDTKPYSTPNAPPAA